MKWAIIYSNLKMFTDEMGRWEDAPGRDVQVILFRDPNLGWTIRHGASGRSRCDFYRINGDGVVVCMDLSGMIDYAVYELGIVSPCTDLSVIIHIAVHEIGVIKQGKMLSQEKWDDVLRFAMAERNRLREEDGST